MKTYIVTYDLRKGVGCADYQKLVALVQEEGIWARLGDAAFLIQSYLTPVELRDKFKCVLDANDMLYVGEVTAPAAWYGYSKEVSDWIISKLKENE